jgi:hypothetical protein
LALFGRLPSARVNGIVTQASENLHKSSHCITLKGDDGKAGDDKEDGSP